MHSHSLRQCIIFINISFLIKIAKCKRKYKIRNDMTKKRSDNFFLNFQAINSDIH